MSQAEKDAAEERRRSVEHAIMGALGVRLCPNIAHADYVHLPDCDDLAALLVRLGLQPGENSGGRG